MFSPFPNNFDHVVPYIGTWIETIYCAFVELLNGVVPYIGTWIETEKGRQTATPTRVVPYIGTWIETLFEQCSQQLYRRRTLYRYVD